jgi:hypothetical protein
VVVVLGGRDSGRFGASALFPPRREIGGKAKLEDVLSVCKHLFMQFICS